MADNKDKKPQTPKEPEKRNYPPDKGSEKLNENIKIPTYQNPPPPPPKKDDQKK
ncbi:MAG: hypothetical protein H6574_07575 [Lewinellaceae bacterium]|nr:hypothetical protein [Lewinellaceae bacterium]